MAYFLKNFLKKFTVKEKYKYKRFHYLYPLLIFLFVYFCLVSLFRSHAVRYFCSKKVQLSFRLYFLFGFVDVQNFPDNGRS